MSNMLYKDIIELVTENQFIHSVNAELSYSKGDEIIKEVITGEIIQSCGLLDKVITNNSSYQFRGTGKIGYLIHDLKIQNSYVDGVRFPSLVLHTCFNSNKSMLRELIMDKQLKKSFVNITNALARAYIHLSKQTHSDEDITDIRALVDSLPRWTMVATFNSIRIKSDPWGVIRSALILKDHYYETLGV